VNRKLFSRKDSPPPILPQVADACNLGEAYGDFAWVICFMARYGKEIAIVAKKNCFVIEKR
jgi:hypothetical protein